MRRLGYSGLGTQRTFFTSEIFLLEKGQPLPRSSHLLRLTPYLDDDGLLRLGGRLQHAALDAEAKNQLILPRVSPITNLLIRQAHLRTLHGGAQLTLATLRQQVWIIGGRAPVRSAILRCVTCTRQRGATLQQRMGQLPALRAKPARPFLHTGVDYAGPFNLKLRRDRSSTTYKGFLVVFGCFTTSAVHLELATTYSTDGFLAAYKRFTGRRGICATLHSDCGTNFVGADKELKRLFSATFKDFGALRSLLATENTAWHFNPPGAPHFGGKWEAAVKSTKYHIRRVIGDSLLTYEEFSSLLVQIECVLNSRPLIALSEDPSDLSVLTPGHFLIGESLNTLPEPSLVHLPPSRLSHWQRTRQMLDHFWQRWSREYLHRHQLVSKWQTPQRQLSPGAVVLIADERYPPSKWPLARVVEVHPGNDGLVRVATLRTAAGATFRRPITKLCLLPVAEQPNAHPTGESAPGESPISESASGESPISEGAPGENPIRERAPGEDPIGESAPGESPISESAPGESPIRERAPGDGPISVGAPGEGTISESASSEDLNGNGLSGKSPPYENVFGEGTPNKGPIRKYVQGETPFGKGNPGESGQIL